MRHVLVAAMGNPLRGDDGFGKRVLDALQGHELPEQVELFDAGSSGMALVEKLLDGFEACVIVDAALRGGQPGSLYVISSPEAHGEVDLHTIDPLKALALARALGASPEAVVFVGCEPARVEDLCEELSSEVERAVPEAVAAVLAEIGRLAAL